MPKKASSKLVDPVDDKVLESPEAALKELQLVREELILGAASFRLGFAADHGGIWKPPGRPLAHASFAVLRFFL